ncbi:SMI1/KNR4 family protein [Paenibacillus sp. CFBP13512]|uniref:SMI1/KNR4 family protein n=1 Tax=Paenibacillus TaxID=44249 RepID=UPI0010BF97AC|nr:MULTISPECIES: SMI1/KNR4 family protein [Paenibacillus]TKJ88364.1 SMI1/KNR4 family protein [Paenibacillus sp. CFBP13512]CAJ1316791.1 SMI1-KNR4 domain-containing protein [Paenibacillus nuruki]
MISLEESEQSLTEHEWQTFANSIDYPIPESFKDFYLQHNGGYLEPLFVDGEEYAPLIHGFMPITYGSLTIEQLMIDMQYAWDILQEVCIPFASDAGGNSFLLRIVPQHYGEVVVWLEEEESIIPCRHSFAELLEDLPYY